MSFTLVLDVLIIVLLGATVAYGITLNRRLVALRANQSELNALVATLNEATGRAEAGIAGLKAGAEHAGAGLQASIDRARRLNDELAHRMDQASRTSERPRVVAEAEPHELRGDGRKRLERELLSALRAAR